MGHPRVTAMARDLEMHSSALNEQEFSDGLRRLCDAIRSSSFIYRLTRHEMTIERLDTDTVVYLLAATPITLCIRFDRYGP